MDSPVSRNRASNSAAERATFRLSAKVATSRASGRNISRSGTLIRTTPRPVRKAFIQLAVRAIGPAMLQRTISSVIRTIRNTCAKALRKVSRQMRRLSPSDVSRVVNNRQAADQFVSPMQRQSIDVDRSDTHPQESVGVVIFLKRLQHDGGRRRHQGLKVGRNGNGMALRIVDCESGQMFTVGELLNRALQRALASRSRSRSTFLARLSPKTSARRCKSLFRLRFSTRT